MRASKADAIPRVADDGAPIGDLPRLPGAPPGAHPTRGLGDDEHLLSLAAVWSPSTRLEPAALRVIERMAALCSARSPPAGRLTKPEH